MERRKSIMLSDCLVIRVQKVFVLLRVGLGVAIYKRSVDSLILLLDSLCGSFSLSSGSAIDRPDVCHICVVGYL
jgi:hypothetical protein